MYSEPSRPGLPDRHEAVVAVGGLDLARAFSRVRWDHLLYTGSPAVGREIAMAAAEQLLPTTLELGGKCPAILAEDAVDASSVEQIVGIKSIKSGQMCISVDYCLVPCERLEDVAEMIAERIEALAPVYASTDSATGMISDRHVERIQSMLEDARARGLDVRSFGPKEPKDPSTRELPLSLVLDPPDDLVLMQDEIFGPILPLKPYDSLDDAIGYVNAGERPLALYVFSQDEAVAEDVLRRTSSGGACVDTAAAHGVLPALSFGGVGRARRRGRRILGAWRDGSSPAERPRTDEAPARVAGAP